MLSPFKAVKQKVSTTYNDITQSHLGQWCKNALIENVVEYTGWIAGKAMGSYVGEYLFSQAAYGSSMLISPLAGYYFSDKVANMLFEEDSFAAEAFRIGSTAITTTILLNTLPDLAADIGYTAGSILLGTATGIAGGYLGVKITGSEEKWIDPENTKTSYTVKRMISIIADAMIGPATGSLVTNFILGQILGSAAFHTTEAIDIYNAIQNKTLLDDILPENIFKSTLFNDTQFKDVHDKIEDVAPGLFSKMLLGNFLINIWKQLQIKAISKA